MKRKLSDAGEIFLQRRYGVRLGRRYVLAAAGVVLMSVLGCSQVNGNTKDNTENLERSRTNTSEYPIAKKKLIMITKSLPQIQSLD